MIFKKISVVNQMNLVCQINIGKDGIVDFEPKLEFFLNKMKHLALCLNFEAFEQAKNKEFFFFFFETLQKGFFRNEEKNEGFFELP